MSNLLLTPRGWSMLSVMRTSLLLLVFVATSTAAAAPKAEILWDRYGVPHIFASDRESMFYANGWAQAQAQGNLLLMLYGESRGRAAEYWGASHLELDRWVQLNGVPERAREWYAAQDPAFRAYLDAFARGINDYAKAHPDTIAPEYRVVLPVSGVDVIGHTLRAVHYMYMGSMERMQREVERLYQRTQAGAPHSSRRARAHRRARTPGPSGRRIPRAGNQC